MKYPTLTFCICANGFLHNEANVFSTLGLLYYQIFIIDIFCILIFDAVMTRIATKQSFAVFQNAMAIKYLSMFCTFFVKFLESSPGLSSHLPVGAAGSH